MFGIGVPELAIILVIAVVFFGVGKLPEIGGAVGKTLKNFKKEVKEVKEGIEGKDLIETTVEVKNGAEIKDGVEINKT